MEFPTGGGLGGVGVMTALRLMMAVPLAAWLVADAEPPTDLGALLRYGVVGAVLVYVLVRIEPRLDRMERALNALTRAQALTLLSRRDVPEPTKEQARQVLRDTGVREEEIPR
jgi:hypothetical protein